MKKRLPAFVAVLLALGLAAAPVLATEATDAAGAADASGQEAVPEAADAGQAGEPQQGEATEDAQASGEAKAAADGAGQAATADDQQAAEEPLAAPAEPAAAGTAFTVEGDPLTYAVLDADALTVVVTGGEAGLTSVAVPATVTHDGVTYRVTEVAAGAFMNCGTISSVTFESPSNLVAIREDAFAFMLKDGTVPATIPSLVLPASLEVLGDGAFHCVPVQRFALEDGSALREIPDGFLAADGLDGRPGIETEATTVWDYVTNWFLELVEPFPFTPTDVARACDCLVSIDLGDGNSLERVGMGAFKNQTHLVSIDFGSGGTARLTIARGAFVAVGNNGAAADAGSEALGGIGTLTLPANLATIESRAFDYARVKNLVLADGCQLKVIPDGFMEVPGIGCNGKPGWLSEYDEEAEETTYSFVYDPVQIGANSLETIDLGQNNSISSIGSGAFKNQGHVTSIDFGTSVAESLTILNGAFIGVGNNGYLVQQGVDDELSAGIETLTLPANLVQIGKWESWNGTDEYLTSGAFDLARIKNLVFSDGCKLEELPSGFLNIYGLDECNGYPGKHFDYSERTTYTSEEDLARYSFVEDMAQIAANCLETVSFGQNNSLRRIGYGAFKNQSHMTGIDFGTSVAEELRIDAGAFIGVGNNGYLVDVGVDTVLNEGIETLTLPANLVSLDSGDFEYARIKNLVFEDGCKLKSLPWGFMVVNGYGHNGHPGEYGDYGGDWDTAWDRVTGRYANHRFVRDSAQIAANSLESISFGKDNSLELIYSGAFYNQSHLRSIDFGTSAAESLTLYSGCFIGAGNNGYLVENGVDDALNEGIETLTLPANLTFMDTGCFDYARVKNLVLEDGSQLETIPNNFLGLCGVGNNGHPGEGAAWDEEAGEYVDHHFVKDMAQIGANTLESISFGQNNSLTTIGAGAFYNQSHVTSIDFGTSTAVGMSIEYGAFIGVGNNTYLVENGIDEELCEGIETLTIPANVNHAEIPYADSSSPIRFNDSLDVTYLNGIEADNAPMHTLFGQEYEYVLIDGLGTSEDWSVADLTGKVAICSRGTYFYYEKANAANAQGAVATIVYGNGTSPEPQQMINMVMHSDTESYIGSNPAVFVSKASGDAIRACSTPVTDEQGNVLYYTGTLCIKPSYRTAEGLQDGAFGFAGIKNLAFEDGFELTALNDGCFQDLDLMESLVLGEDCTLTELGGGAFSKCDELTTVDLRDTGITTIGDSLKENPKLECVYFPETLQAVTWTVEDGDGDPDGKCPFYGSGAVNEMHFAATDPANMTFTDDVFQFVANAGIVFVPVDTTDEAIEAYKAKLTDAGLVFGDTKWRILREGRIFVDVYGPSDEGDGVTAHYDDINWLARAGISTGWVDAATGDRTFRPYADVTRADMAAFLYRLAGSPAFTPTAKDKAYFTDVNAKTPHAKEIWWLASTGISKGWTMKNGTHQFRPYANVARCDMAAFLYRLAGSPSFTPSAADRAYFSDVNAKTAHATEVWWLYSTGVSQGWTEEDGTHTFRPLDTVARADMAAFLRRMYRSGIVPETV